MYLLFKETDFGELYISNYLGIYPEIFLIWSLMVLISFFVIYDNKYNNQVNWVKLCGYLTLLVLLLTLMLTWTNFNVTTFFLFEYLFIVDDLSVLLKIILLISMIFVVFMSFTYLEKEKIMSYEYYILILLAGLGMLIMTSVYDLISLYLAIELQSLSLYILATFKPYNNFSTEAGLKYFILGAISSGLMLFGCSLIYGFSGTTSFFNLQRLFFDMENMTSILFLGIIFLSIGILFKLGAAPYHMWVPDVYEGVPTIVTMFFAIIPKIAVIGLFIRLGLSFFMESFMYFNQLLLFSVVLSLIIGTFGALYQIKLKRLLAYSAIGHVGYFLLGLSFMTLDGLFATLFYLVVYLIISINIFSIILVLRKKNNNLKIKNLYEIIVLFKSNPMLSIMFCLIMFSIAGIPPLLGFYSKYFIFLSAIKNQLYFIVLFAAIVSVIACMYYIRFIKLMFFRVYKYRTFLYEITLLEALIISYTFLLNIYFVFFPNIFILPLYNIVLTLFF